MVSDYLDALVAPITGFTGYKALSTGGIIGPSGKLLKPHDGRISVSLGGTKHTANVAPLIFASFHGAVPKYGLTFRDGDKLNAALRNLVPCFGSWKPVRHCRAGHLLTPDECATWGTGNRVCRRCHPSMPKVLPLISNYSMAYGVGQPPQ